MMAKHGTTTAMPSLRFPEYRKTAAWNEEKLEELIVAISPPAKLPSSSYQASGKFPIVDQSQEAICGWTDDTKAVVDAPLPLIVFGDHTCALKFVERPFAQGADGIKILAAKPAISIRYLFQSLNHQPLVMEDYKRHFSILKERKVFFPNVESGEQQKIADCLTSLDDVIAAQGRKVDALKAHKRGLMQQLFLREGEARPRLRFPEFRNAAEWEQKLGGTLFESRKEGGEEGLPIYSVTVNDGMIPRASFDRDFYDIEDPAKNKKVCKGDIAYNMMRMWQGAQGVAVEDCMVSPAYVVLSPVEGVCSSFFAYLFKLTQSLELLTAYSRGLTKDRLRLYFEDFARMPLRVPRYAEQQRIAEFLSSVDTQITAESLQLGALKSHKQGLMQQLFPAPEGAAA